MSHSSSGPKLHRDWRMWVAVLLMLAAMLTYVFTLDDSTAPVPQPEAAPVAPANP